MTDRRKGYRRFETAPLAVSRGLSIFRLMSSKAVTAAEAGVDSAQADAAIVERIRNGEPALYEVLVRRYNQRMYRVARSFLHDEAEAEDVMQEAYLKAFTALPRFQGRAQFSTWLTRILINCALAHLRTRSRRREVALDDVMGPTVRTAQGNREAGRSDGDLRIAQEQIGRLIERTLETLPSKYRIVFAMRELEEMSVAETAAALGISPENTKVRLHRAQRLLREGLRRRMPDIALYGFLGGRCDALTSRVMEAIALLPAAGQEDFFPV
jgi:RNA polymerase sigma-70 factor, ECF subfamily